MAKLKETIKRATLSVLLSVICAPLVNAEENKHEISLGYGLGSSYDLANMLDNEIDGLPDEYEMKKHTRTFCLEYLYRRDKKVSFGGIVCFSNQTFEHNLSRANDGFHIYESYYKAAETNHSRLLLMPKLHLQWFDHEKVCMYSKFAIGGDIKFIHEKAVDADYVPDNKVKFNLAGQLSPIGVSAGSEHVRFFAELGFGCQSILECGLSYRFGN